MGKSIQFLFQVLTVGLAAFIVLVFLKPELIDRGGTVVEILQETTAPAAINTIGRGPVSYADAVEQTSASVVNIYTAKIVTERANPLQNDPFFKRFFEGTAPVTPRKRLETSLGSGVIVSSQGYVLTNNHVIQGADEIRVVLANGETPSAKVVGTDPDTDLAVLKINYVKLPAITIGQSKTLRVGDVVLAIGNPFGVGKTVTMGIVSATGRNQLGINTFENFIQTDAAINPGNSGGALINANGKLVGINTAIFSRSGGSQGIGFAIPASLARDVMQQIIEHGRVLRGWLGIEAQDLTPQLAESLGFDNTEGVLIAAVLLGGPADQAQLKAGDIIVTINFKPVINSRDSLNQIAGFAPDTSITLGIIRQGKKIEVNAVVNERPKR
ncbi:MAG: Do family serine endopeptidase [Sulfuriflexus sp.]|nr:Do family serine endopeptidase [Sulfuriflexus sp.]